MKYSIALIALALLSGCSENADIKEAIKERLVDPDSATFGEITVIEGETGKYACATTNSKNSMGGYTGDSQMYLGFEPAEGKWKVVGDVDEYSHEDCIGVLRKVANDPIED